MVSEHMANEEPFIKCDTCTQLHGVCSYTAVDGRKTRHKEPEVAALLDRIAFLEQKLDDLGEPSSDRMPHTPQTSRDSAFDENSWIPSDDPVWSTNLPLPSDAHSTVVDDYLSTASHILMPNQDFLAEASSSASTGAKEAALSPLGGLVSVMGDLQLDTATGETRWVGPTSNLHVMPYFLRLNNRDQALCGDGSIESSVLHHEAVAVFSFWTQFHPHFPIFGIDAAEDALHTEWPDIIHHMMLALGHFFHHPDTKSCVQHQLEQFTNLLGREVDNLCVRNVEAFLLRAYLAVVMGKLESATIFTGISVKLLLCCRGVSCKLLTNMKVLPVAWPRG